MVGKNYSGRSKDQFGSTCDFTFREILSTGVIEVPFVVTVISTSSELYF
jgi:hypothetical protein